MYAMIALRMPSETGTITTLTIAIVPVQKAFSLFTRRSAKTNPPRIQAKAVIDALTMLTVTGAHFGELEYGIAIEATPLTDWILTAAREHTAGLVTQVTDTNRKLIQEAIKQGIARGEDRDAMVARIRKVISNPVRAEMIAQTESVNAYQSGLLNFAQETGANTKTWEALAGACKVCAPLDGETVAIDDQFSNGIDAPSAHPRCRCGVIYNY